MAKSKQSLTPKQQKFVAEYLIDLNATQAAIRAGYSPKTAKDIACENLAKPNLQQAIQAGREKLRANAQVSAARVIEELAMISFADMGEILDFSGETVKLKPANQISERGRRMLSSVKVRRTVEGAGRDAREVEITEFKLWSKDSALEKLAKHLDLYRDGTVVDINAGPVFKVYLGFDPEEV